jgi:ribose transport system substrate-binding protein
MKARNIFGIIVTILFMSLLCGCHTSSRKKIGFVVTTLSNPYFIEMVNGAKDVVKNHPEIELLVQAPDKAVDNDKQLQIIENMITQKVDVICVVPSDSKSIISSIEKANKANIPIIILDNNIDTILARQKRVTIATFIGSDNYQGGQLAAQYILEKLNKNGDVAILEGVSGVDAAIKRKSGFIDFMNNYKTIRIVASQPADWEREKGMNVLQNIIRANPNLNAVFACNDEMALGAIQAIKDAKKGGKIIIVGFDATPDGRAAVKKKEMSATIAQQPTFVGAEGVKKAIMLLNSENINGSYKVEVSIIK